MQRSVIDSGIGFGFAQMISWRSHQPASRSAKAIDHGMPMRSFGFMPAGTVHGFLEYRLERNDSSVDSPEPSHSGHFGPSPVCGSNASPDPLQYAHRCRGVAIEFPLVALMPLVLA